MAFVTKIFYMAIISGEGSVSGKGEEGFIIKWGLSSKAEQNLRQGVCL